MGMSLPLVHFLILYQNVDSVVDSLRLHLARGLAPAPPRSETNKPGYLFDSKT